LLEKAQQEAVEKAEQLIENTYDSVLDLAGMLLEGVLETGKEVIESEVKRFIKKSLNELTPKIL
ncbi:hypothetical protein CGH26_27545, partial [Vibrio parahaemolyticus]